MFQKYPTILQTADAKKIIKNYNKLAKVLLEFEVLYHQAWMKQVYDTDCSYKVTTERFVPKKTHFPPGTTTLSRSRVYSFGSYIKTNFHVFTMTS